MCTKRWCGEKSDARAINRHSVPRNTLQPCSCCNVANKVAWRCLPLWSLRSCNFGHTLVGYILRIYTCILVVCGKSSLVLCEMSSIMTCTTTWHAIRRRLSLTSCSAPDVKRRLVTVNNMCSVQSLCQSSPIGRCSRYRLTCCASPTHLWLVGLTTACHP